MQNTKSKFLHIFLVSSLILASFFVFSAVLAQEPEATAPPAETAPEASPAEAPAAESPTAEVPAAETPAAEVPADVQQALEQAAETSLKEAEKPEEVKIDETVEAEDLGVKEAKILPDNPLYVFKEIGRGVKTFFTFDPVKKSEVQLDIANKKMIEAQQLIEDKGTEKAIEAAQEVIAEASENFEKIAARAEDIKEKRDKAAPRVEEFLDKIIDNQLKHQKLLQKLEEQVPEQAFIKIEEAREEQLDHFADVMTGVAEKHEEITERITKIVDAQEGSDLKELKSLEILKNLEEKMPEEAREAIAKAQENVADNLQKKISAMHKEGRSEKLGKYMEFMPGHAVRQFEMLDKVKAMFDDPELIKDMEALKDKAVRKFEDRFAKFTSDEAKDKFMGHLKDGDPGDMRTIMQMEMRMGPPPMPSEEGLMPPPPVFGPPPGLKEAMQKVHEESAGKFRERFANDPEALKKADAVQKALSNPDAMDFKLLKEIEESMPAEQKKFAKELQKEAQKKMIEQFGPPPGMPVPLEGEMPFGPPPPFMMERFVESGPQGLEMLKELKEQLPPEAMRGIEQAIKTQVKMMSEQMEKMDDPQMFERYEQEIKGNEELSREIRRQGPPDFFRMMGERGAEMEKAQEQFEQMKEQKMQEMQQQMFMPPEEGGKEFGPPPPDVMQMVPPEMRERMKEFRKEMNGRMREMPLPVPMPSQLREQGVPPTEGGEFPGKPPEGEFPGKPPEGEFPGKGYGVQPVPPEEVKILEGVEGPRMMPEEMPQMPPQGPGPAPSAEIPIAPPPPAPGP